MRLIISIVITFKKVSCCSGYRRVPWVSNMEWLKLVIDRMMPVRIRGHLNKLLSPIQESGSNYHEEPIFPIQRAFNKCREAYRQVYHSKKVTPDKSEYLFRGFHIELINSHYFSSKLHHQNNTVFIKNVIINIKKLKIVGLLLKESFLHLFHNLKEQRL